MSGSSLAAHPPSGGRRAAHWRKPGLFARFLCALVLRARLVGVSPCFVLAGRPAATGSRAHTVLPTRLGVGVSVFAWGWQQGLLWSCLLAGGWVGCLRYCPCSLGVFARLLVCARLGVAGQCGCVRPFTLACLRAHAFGVGAVGVCGVLRCPMGGGRSGRGGTIVSRPYVLLVSLLPLRCVQEKGWGALVVC